MGGTSSLQNRRSTHGIQLLAAVVLLAGTLAYWTSTSTATPTSAFEIEDRNIVDSPAGDPYDWGALFETVGAGVSGPVTPTAVSGFEARTFAADPISSDPLPSVDGEPCDAGKKGDLTVFTSAGSDKTNDPPSTWSYQSGSVPDAKDDLTNVYAAAKKDGADTIFYYALERSKTNGDAHVDFEFYRSPIGLAVSGSDSDGCPKGNFTGSRTVGDVLVSMDFDNGGVVGTPTVRQWNGTTYAVVNATGNVGFFQNGSSSIACGDWACRDATGNVIATLPVNAFVEGYLNVSGLFGSNVGCFSTFLAKTRSSTSGTSELKDFAMGSFNTCDASITLTPSGVNAVGTNHTFTATVQSNETGTMAPKAGALVTGAISGIGSFVGGNTCTTAATGQCTLTITSATPGTSTVNASTTVNVSGVSITRSTATNPGPGGAPPSPATKNWVDAYINVTPDDVNPVGQSHVFTVEYGVLTGGATGLSIATPTITPTVTPSGGSPALTTNTDTCATPQQVAGTDVWRCTVTINSSGTGVYTATATGSTTVTMAGGTPETATLTRSTATDATNGPAPGNLGATKTYVDARVLLSPDGLNQVDDPTTPAIEDAHTLTATVQTKVGTGDWANVGAGTTVTFNLTGDGVFVGNDSDCVTGAGGTCTVQINATSHGISTVTATAARITTATTPAVTLSRTSPSITKQWVDAQIVVSDDGINPLDEEHRFTITVTPLAPAGVAVTNVSITPSMVTTSGATPTVTGTDCDGNVPLSSGTATCTYTINSSAPGVTDVDAATTVSYSWTSNSVTHEVSVTRSTSAGAYPGPNGNTGATKTYVDARVSVREDGVNVIGTPHDVTGRAEFNDGTGWKPAAGETITYVIETQTDGATATFVNGASCTANAQGECTVQIVSNTPGVTWVSANTSYDVPNGSGPTLVRTSAASGATDPDNLRKEWVSAGISITPTATNTVGEPHEFTVVVTANAASADITIDGIQTSVSPTPSTPGSLSCGAQQATASGATRTCTITINSSTPGVFSANASATVTIAGLSQAIPVTTDGQGANSGPAVKTYVDARLTLDDDGVNEVGDPHPVTATVRVNDGTSGWVSPGAGITVNLVEDGPGSIPAACETDPDGTCTVQLTSPAAGVSTVNATVTVTVGGEVITRSTSADAQNLAAGGSGPLTKRWIDGVVAINPSAVNPVGAEHVFTITATAIPSGAGAPSFEITPSVSPTPTSADSTCGSPAVDATTNTATCTLTINNDTPGLFTANASVTITVAGVSLTRNTDPSDTVPAGSGGSDSATKRYVDAAIQIGPDGINQVGEPHTVVAHVDVDDGNGPQPAPDGTTIAITRVSGPGTLSAPSCVTAGGTGSCSVTLTSTSVGVTILSASSTVSVSGVPLTVTTNGAGANSDELEKDWVDGFIKVTPDAVNEVNDPHTFTVEYTVSAPDGTTVTLDSLTADATPDPDTQETSCSPERAGNTWTCTVTINSSATGVFEIDASGSATVTDATIPGASRTVARSTTGNAGTGGNDGAEKTYVDARVTITPDGVNEVGDPHQVDVVVEVDEGDGWGPAPAGVTVELSETGPGSIPETCTTDGTGTCTTTLTSSEAGVSIVHASVTLAVLGENITRETSTASNAAAGGSDDLTKRWIDGFITIGPSAVNPLNEEHEFTVTATVVPSGASPVVFDAITTSVSPTPGSVESTCGEPTVTGSTATCTLTINSSVPGTFVANATVEATVGGTPLVRSTDATIAPAGPGGSGPATKEYVAPVVLPEVSPTILGEVLSRTGGDVGRMVVVALWLIAGGVVLLAGARLRRRAAPAGRG